MKAGILHQTGTGMSHFNGRMTCMIGINNLSILSTAFVVSVWWKKEVVRAMQRAAQHDQSDHLGKRLL